MEEHEKSTAASHLSGTTERVRHVQELVQQALTLPVGNRRPFLSAACDADTLLLSEALAFLEANGSLEPVTVVPSLSHMSAYRFERELGRGGMGVVYLAEQLEPLRRFVAVKLINVGNTQQAVRRFEAERQTLALMDHSYIAHVYDAGTTNDGRLFFAMEYVAGISITEFCNKHRLTIRSRLELFVHVCAAVQHAHQKGIIHRDLKPSNVLVVLQDDRPVPKVIDFGIAKATSRYSTQTINTEQGWPIGTPEYMSPEQTGAPNPEPDTRTDIYSLGVMLYELLTGTVPFEGAVLRRAGYAEMQRIIREEEPERPSSKLDSLGSRAVLVAQSRQTTPPGLVRQLRGDLDWITLKALEKDRTRRYESASELASDIRHYLEDEPVIARSPSISYRSRKFVRKHRRAAAVAATLLLMLTTGLVVSTTLYVRANRSRQETDEQRRLQEVQRMAAEASASEARRQRDEADTQRRTANVQRSVAETSQREAVHHRRIAEQQEREAATQRLAAERERDEAVHHSYRSALLAADLSLRQGDTEEARRQLELTDSNLRGWEWRYLRRMADSSVARFDAFEGVRDIAFRASDDELIALGGYLWILQGRFGRIGKIFASKSGSGNFNRESNRVRLEETATTVVALSSDGMRALTIGWNLTVAVPTCSNGVTGQGALCEPAWLSSPADQTGRPLTAEERDRLMVIETASGQVIATIIHPRLGVWTGFGGAIGPPLIKSGSLDSTSVVDRSTARTLMKLAGRYPDVISAAFSPDATRLATWSWDNIIHVWDVRTQMHLAALRGHSGAISSGGFLGREEFVSSSGDGTIRFWAIGSEKETALIKVPEASVIALSPSGTRVAVGTETGAIQIWERGATSPHLTLHGHQGAISALAFSPNSLRLASSAASDASIALWDATTSVEPVRLQGHSARVLALAWNRTGELLASGSADRTFRMWNAMESGAALELKGHTAPVRAIAISSLSDEMVSASMDGTLRLWNVARAQTTGTVNLDAQPGEKAMNQFAVLSADGQRIAVPYHARGASVVRLIDVNRRLPTVTLPIDAGVIVDAGSSQDGSTLAVILRTENASRVQVWDVPSGRSKFHVSMDGFFVQALLAISASSNRLAVCLDRGPDTQILVVEISSGRILRTIRVSGARGFSTRPTLTSDGRHLVTGHFNGTVQVWDLESGEVLSTLHGHDGPVSALIVSPDGKRIVSGGMDTSVRVWDAHRHELLLTLRTHAGVTALAAGGKGREIAAGTASGILHVWDSGDRSGR